MVTVVGVLGFDPKWSHSRLGLRAPDFLNSRSSPAARSCCHEPSQTGRDGGLQSSKTARNGCIGSSAEPWQSTATAGHAAGEGPIPRNRAFRKEIKLFVERVYQQIVIAASCGQRFW